MRQRAFLLLLLGLATQATSAQVFGHKPKPVHLEVLDTSDFSHLIHSIPDRAHFGISGLAYFDGELYVATNLGIIDVHNGVLVRLLRLGMHDQVFSHPTVDDSTHTLWINDDGAGGFLRFDGRQWLHIKKPTPHGGYTRGDVLANAHPIGNSDGLWFAAGGGAWTWNNSSMTWVPLSLKSFPLKSDSYFNQVPGLLPMGKSPLVIIATGDHVLHYSPQAPFTSDEVGASGERTPIKSEGASFVSETWVVTKDAGYICSDRQSLHRVTPDLVAQLAAPGACEAIATDADNNLLASIRTKGIFRYTPNEGWVPVAPSPYPTGEGKYWTYLAASKDEMALAIDGKPIGTLVGNGHMTFTRNAPTTLWVLRDGAFAPVALQ